MGLATAYSISKTAHSKVLLLDRYGVGNDYCSSNDVNRVFRYSYGNDELYTRMAVESLKLWKNLERQRRDSSTPTEESSSLPTRYRFSTRWRRSKGSK